MKRKISGKVIVSALTAALLTTSLTGCTFGFASDPDDPNEVVEEVPIDTSVDSFQYDSSLSGTSITLLNSKAEIQVALEKMSAAYEEIRCPCGGHACDRRRFPVYKSGQSV